MTLVGPSLEHFPSKSASQDKAVHIWPPNLLFATTPCTYRGPTLMCFAEKVVPNTPTVFIECSKNIWVNFFCILIFLTDIFSRAAGAARIDLAPHACARKILRRHAEPSEVQQCSGK